MKTDPKPDADLPAALARIQHLSRPGQEVGLGEALDIICEIWNVARAATPQTPEG